MPLLRWSIHYFIRHLTAWSKKIFCLTFKKLLINLPIYLHHQINICHGFWSACYIWCNVPFSISPCAGMGWLSLEKSGMSVLLKVCKDNHKSIAPFQNIFWLVYFIAPAVCSTATETQETYYFKCLAFLFVCSLWFTNYSDPVYVPPGTGCWN